MGQFTTRPEEPTEWAGLPSEPIESRSEAESLAPPAAGVDSLAFLGTAIESVVVPVVPNVEIAQSASDSDEGDRPASDRDC